MYCHEFFGPRPGSFGPVGPKSAARFCPTHPDLVRPGLAVAVTSYPWLSLVIRMRAHWIAISSIGRAYGELVAFHLCLYCCYSHAMPRARELDK